jgi:N-acyl-D-amino-acid deacylase
MVSRGSPSLIEGWLVLPTRCTYLFTGGLVVDGTGEPARFADVVVDGERIIAVGANLLQAYIPDQLLNITGSIIAPGFIDLHTHSDVTALVNPKMESSVHQGVTTELVGNCGMSIGLVRDAPQFQRELSWLQRAGIDVNWADLGSFLRRVEDQGLAINLATLAGHGTIRVDVMGFSESSPTTQELAMMTDRLEVALADGAFGLSSGLEYLPGGYAKLDELCALADIAKNAGGFYASHIRDERDHLVSSVEEALAVGYRSKIPVQLSHHKVERRRNWGRIRETLGMMRTARENGLDVATDQYPYTAFMTGLAVILLPTWAQAGGGKAMAERLADPESRAKIAEHIIEDNPDWDQIRIGTARNRRDVQGLTLAALGRVDGASPLDAALNLLMVEEGMVLAAYFAMSEDDVEEIMRDPYTMIGSDGVSAAITGRLAEDHTHPRTFGTFPRILGEYVRRRGVLTIEEAIRRMTSLPASRMRVKDRGCIDSGYYADLVVFDPATIVDTATFDDPYQYPLGIQHVLVNGKLALTDGIQTEALAGKVLRRSA